VEARFPRFPASVGRTMTLCDTFVTGMSIAGNWLEKLIIRPVVHHCIVCGDVGVPTPERLQSEWLNSLHPVKLTCCT
jgi:hypothetical protein